MDFITIQIQQDDFSFIPLEIPLGVELSLMEVLRGENHPIDAICGGMAICGTCRVEVLNKDEVDLEGINDAEMCMLDSLPCNTGNCRLSCQIKISEKVDGLKILIPTDF
ncbi:MAG TPA: 2Fe-2S iron-sulfur cluster-binding protein [Chitinophagales bacterium]|nr:(2Fe-2S)-binding protein [Chitinophagales bacterium]MBP6153214.1 (2Fe-2S)-binding protein [Chitinophagales bacterium]HQV78884.1 2Fe-2S iron-sulfur cluster-binding protein [Chitinophagales bacterium]HQW79250.1 2Fe-2S iron-sulfur cluster-binding protein [Chitinophagales bacterium]HRB19460.1 2Fe-2S iron-sulfur cluster-binding protein [Chitinophagales bacterium]